MSSDLVVEPRRMCVSRLPARCKWGLCSSGMFSNTDVSGETYSPIFEGSNWTLKMGPDRLSRNVGNYQSALRNIPEERRCHEPRRIFAILKTSDLTSTSVKTAALSEGTSRMLHTCGFWGSVRGVIEETCLLRCDAASRGVYRRFEGLCCLHLEGFSAPHCFSQNNNSPPHLDVCPTSCRSSRSTNRLETGRLFGLTA